MAKQPNSRAPLDSSSAVTTRQITERPLFAWQVGYLAAWAVSVLVASVVSCVYVDPPIPKDLHVRIGPAVQLGCSESRVSGQVTLADVPVEGAEVSITAMDLQDNVLNTYSASTGKAGDFSQCITGHEPKKLRATATILLDKLADQPDLRWYKEIMNPACDDPGWKQEPCCNRVRGATGLDDSPRSIMTRLQLRVPRWLFIGGIGSLLLGLYASILGTQRIGLLASIALSLATVFVAMGMLGIILIGYVGVLWNHEAVDVFQTPLGYLTQGSFHAEVATDWLFSLTLPERLSPETAKIRGFGAPMWTILLATIGACIIALQNLIRTPFEIDDNDTIDTHEELDGRMADQLFSVVFAPLGAIYVYQTLLELGITRTVPVAVIMLASGLALNHLVTVASRRVKGVIGRAIAPLRKDRREGPEHQGEG